MNVNFFCLEDRVLLRPIKPKDLEKTAAGIIKTDVVPKPVSKGEVVSVGEGYTARDTGVFVQTRLAKGDIVIYLTGVGQPIDSETENGSEELIVMREGDCLVLISEKSDK